jgi:diketogulonate reductase-like aldo/keto reductase
VKAIGLSNFNSAQIGSLLDSPRTRIQPAVLQVERHPFFTQTPLLSYCKQHGIVMTAYSPLGSGATVELAATATTEAGEFAVASHPLLAAIGQAHNKRSAAQVAIAWQIHQGVVVIPKSVTAARIQANADVFFDFEEHFDPANKGAPSAAETRAATMQAIAQLDQDKRMGWGGPIQVGADGTRRPRDEAHPQYPFRQLDAAFF